MELWLTMEKPWYYGKKYSTMDKKLWYYGQNYDTMDKTMVQYRKVRNFDLWSEKHDRLQKKVKLWFIMGKKKQW